MAALPDLMASDAILAITSGRASKMMSKTPIGQLTRSRSRPSSRRVFNVVLPTRSYRAFESLAPQWLGFLYTKRVAGRIPWRLGL